MPGFAAVVVTKCSDRYAAVRIIARSSLPDRFSCPIPRVASSFRSGRRCAAQVRRGIDEQATARCLRAAAGTGPDRGAAGVRAARRLPAVLPPLRRRDHEHGRTQRGARAGHADRGRAEADRDEHRLPARQVRPRRPAREHGYARLAGVAATAAAGHAVPGPRLSGGGRDRGRRRPRQDPGEHARRAAAMGDPGSRVFPRCSRERIGGARVLRAARVQGQVAQGGGRPSGDPRSGGRIRRRGRGRARPAAPAGPAAGCGRRAPGHGQHPAQRRRQPGAALAGAQRQPGRGLHQHPALPGHPPRRAVRQRALRRHRGRSRAQLRLPGAARLSLLRGDRPRHVRAVRTLAADRAGRQHHRAHDAGAAAGDAVQAASQPPAARAHQT